MIALNVSIVLVYTYNYMSYGSLIFAVINILIFMIVMTDISSTRRYITFTFVMFEEI